MFSKAISMMGGALIAHFYSDGFFPAFHAAWSWECTYYADSEITKPVYMAVNATDGPTCADNTKLTCSCKSSPCEGPAAATLSNLACAGAGDDTLTSGCFKLHHHYGIAGAPISFVAGRGKAEQVTDACGTADVIKVYGHADGMTMLVSWGALTTDLIDNSTHPASAQECQTLCAANADCKFFTFNDQGLSGGNYGYFRGLCVLQKALACNGTAYSTYHGAISGPSACPDGVTVPPAPAPAPAPPALADIVDTAVAAGSFKTLAAALTTADLVTTLKGTGPFTVFAPTDDAFGKLLKEMGVSAEELLATPKEELTGVLTYHVASGSVLSTDLSNGMKVTTVNGEKLTIKIDGATVMVNDATVVTADVKASNGVIHIIDKVLVPPKMEDAHDDHDDHDHPTTTAAATTAAAESSSVDAAYKSQGLASLTLIGILSAMLFA